MTQTLILEQFKKYVDITARNYLKELENKKFVKRATKRSINLEKKGIKLIFRN